MYFNFFTKIWNPKFPPHLSECPNFPKKNLQVLKTLNLTTAMTPESESLTFTSAMLSKGQRCCKVSWGKYVKAVKLPLARPKTSSRGRLDTGFIPRMEIETGWIATNLLPNRFLAFSYSENVSLQLIYS